MVIAIAHADWDAQRRAWVLDQRRALADHQVVVVKDYGDGVWATNRRAWQVLARGTGHGLWLQDDMLPVPGLSDVLAQLARPEPVSLFTMRGAVIDAAREAEASWVSTPDAIYGGTILAPCTLFARCLAWADSRVDPSYPHDDRRMSMFCYLRGIPILTTIPSLLIHAGAASSLLGHGNAHRPTWTARHASEWHDGRVIRMPGTLPMKQEARRMGLTRRTTVA